MKIYEQKGQVTSEVSSKRLVTNVSFNHTLNRPNRLLNQGCSVSLILLSTITMHIQLKSKGLHNWIG